MDTDVSCSCSSNSLSVDNSDFIDTRVAYSSSTNRTKSAKGVRVLLVDYDLVFLHVMLRMLKMFDFEAVGIRGGLAGLKLLRENPCYCDLVVIAVYMPGMSGHELLRHIKQEFTTLPVILVSNDADPAMATKEISNGAAGLFLHKPVTYRDIEKMWRHVHKSKVDQVVKKNTYNKQTGSSVDEQDSLRNKENNRSINGSPSGDDEGNSRVESRKRKESNKDQSSDDKRNCARTNKTQRVVWTAPLHTHFLNAIDSLGVDRAVPKRILEWMKVPGLTRENVASHLQKYRLFIKGMVERNENIDPNTMKFLASGAFLSNFAPDISAMDMHQTDAPQPSFTPCHSVIRTSDFQGLNTDQTGMSHRGPSTLNTSSSGGYNNASFQFGQSSMRPIDNTQVLLPTSAKQTWPTSNNNKNAARVSPSQSNSNVFVGGGRSGKGTMEMVHRQWRSNAQITAGPPLNLGTHSMIGRFNLQTQNNAEMLRNKGTTGNMGSSSVGSFAQGLTTPSSNNFIGIRILNNNNSASPETLRVGPIAHKLSHDNSNTASNLEFRSISKPPSISSVMEVSNQMPEVPNMSSSVSAMEEVPNVVPEFPGIPPSVSATELWNLGYKYDLTDQFSTVGSEEVSKLIPNFFGITTAQNEASIAGGILNANPQQETAHPKPVIPAPALAELKETEVDQAAGEGDPFEGLFDLARRDSNFGMDSLPPLLDRDDFTDFLENFEQSTTDQGGALYDGENLIDPSFDISMYIN